MRTKVRIRVAVAVTLAVLLVGGFQAFALGLVGVGSATSLSSIPAACPLVREEPRPQPFFSNARRHPVPFTATAAVLCLYKQEPSNTDPTGYAETFSRQLVISDPAKADALATELNTGARRGPSSPGTAAAARRASASRRTSRAARPRPSTWSSAPAAVRPPRTAGTSRPSRTARSSPTSSRCSAAGSLVRTPPRRTSSAGCDLPVSHVSATDALS